VATRDSGGSKNLNIKLLNRELGVTGHAKRVFGHAFLILSGGTSPEYCTKKNREENMFPPGYTLFFNKNIVFPAQAECCYFSADSGLKTFL